MYSLYPDVGFEVAQESLSRIGHVTQGIERFSYRLTLATEEEVALFAHEVAAAWYREFKPHDRTGKEDDPSNWNPNYVHSIDTLEVRLMGMAAIISMRGGAVYVQWGTSPHIIRAKYAANLHFRGSQGWVTTKQVNHPGYPGDDFLGRALRDVGYVKAFAHILQAARIAQFTDTLGHIGPVWVRN